MRKYFSIIVLFLITYSCATAPSTSIPEYFNSNSDEGMIVGTIAIENQKPIFNQYFFHYAGEFDSGISVSKMITIRPEQMVKMKFKPDFIDDNKVVYYFSVTQKNGNYKFITIRLHSNGGYVQSHRNISMDIPFNIEKGKVKYIGEIYLNYNLGIVRINNKRTRDIPKFNEKYPNLKIE